MALTWREKTLRGRLDEQAKLIHVLSRHYLEPIYGEIVIAAPASGHVTLGQLFQCQVLNFKHVS